MGVKNYAEGQAVFVDTPGIHRPLHRMNVRMVDTRRRDARRGRRRRGRHRRDRRVPGAGLRYLLDLVKDTQGEDDSDSEQDRSRQEAQAVADASTS